MNLNASCPIGLSPSQVQRIQSVVTALVYLTPDQVTEGKLNKLLYIAELKHLKHYGERLCPARIYHWKHGPYSHDVRWVLDLLDGDALKIELHEGAMGEIRSRTIRAARQMAEVALDEETIEFLRGIAEEWGTKNFARTLIPYTYATRPFAETALYNVIDLERYEGCPPDEREDIDYAPSTETRRAINAALRIKDEEIDHLLESVNA